MSFNAAHISIIYGFEPSKMATTERITLLGSKSQNLKKLVLCAPMVYIKHNKTPMKIKRQPKSDSVCSDALAVTICHVRFVLLFLDIKNPSIEVKSNETNYPKNAGMHKDVRERERE